MLPSRLLTLPFLLYLGVSVFAQHSSMKMDSVEKPQTLMSGLGSLHHPVTTTSVEAQRWFNQGLALVYAFNHDEAVRSFKRAAELDPKLAMAHWGEALALGPNINMEVDPAREKAACEAVQKAQALAAGASENERAYIAALAKRYAIDPQADLKKLDADYKYAMSELARNYPDDLDAATLYAESAMDLRPWKLWTADGKPAPGTEEIVAVLESVLRRNPNHPGAIHYYIHAIEASPYPERALAYAPKLGELMPAAGHLVHMPAHIYERTGDYENAAQSNRDAAAADRAYMEKNGARGIYPLMYYSHNLHFLAIAQTMEGRLIESLNAAKLLDGNVGPALKEMPMLEGFMTVTPLIYVRFNRWEEVRKLRQPDPSFFGLTAVHHFARGMAYASTGDVAHAVEQQQSFAQAVSKIPVNASFGLNPARKVMSIADAVLSARIASAKGDNPTALELLRKGVEIEDSLAYDEPQTWFLPVREMLGGALIKNGDFAAAEQVFRADLERNKRNGRSLFGLMLSLKAQKKDYAAALVQREYDLAWKNADDRLTLKDLWQ
ncbi:MAG: Tetratricopeptide 2 repeat protein [Acidobacteria bacterium]|nr:Tetratricopeptide 2 repeat protein [Acidobacteriota bacterium]